MQRGLTHVEVPQDVVCAIEPIGDCCRPIVQKLSNVCLRLSSLLASDDLEGLKGALAVQIAVIGHNGTGKSSLIDALVQRPGMVDSTKSVSSKKSTVIYFGQDTKGKLTSTFDGQTVSEIQLDQRPFAVPTALMEISGTLAPPLVPGNGFRLERIPSLDACVVVLDAARIRVADDLGFQAILETVDRRSLIIFVNRIDELENVGCDVGKICAALRGMLANQLYTVNIPIIFGCARWALCALSSDRERHTARPAAAYDNGACPLTQKDRTVIAHVLGIDTENYEPSAANLLHASGVSALADKLSNNIQLGPMMSSVSREIQRLDDITGGLLASANTAKHALRRRAVDTAAKPQWRSGRRFSVVKKRSRLNEIAEQLHRIRDKALHDLESRELALSSRLSRRADQPSSETANGTAATLLGRPPPPVPIEHRPQPAVSSRCNRYAIDLDIRRASQGILDVQRLAGIQMHQLLRRIAPELEVGFNFEALAVSPASSRRRLTKNGAAATKLERHLPTSLPGQRAFTAPHRHGRAETDDASAVVAQDAASARERIVLAADQVMRVLREVQQFGSDDDVREQHEQTFRGRLAMTSTCQLAGDCADLPERLGAIRHELEELSERCRAMMAS